MHEDGRQKSPDEYSKDSRWKTMGTQRKTRNPTGVYSTRLREHTHDNLKIKTRELVR